MTKFTYFLAFLLLPLVSSALEKKMKLYAGPDQTVAVGEVVQLNGTAFHINNYAWKTSGTGKFTNPYQLVTDYVPNQHDITNGFVTLTLYDTKNKKRFDSLILTIKSCLTVDILAAADTICGFDLGVAYHISAEVAGTNYQVQWTSSGTGYFHDETSALTTYEASPGDTGSGGVLLTVTVSDSAGTCQSISDSLFLKLNDPARINLPDETISVCGDSPIRITADISGTATSVNWSTNGTGHFTLISPLEADFYPSATDRLSGSVTIFGTTNNPSGPCVAERDEIEINMYGAAVDAGVDIEVCPEVSGGTVNVSANYTNGASIFWSSSGSGFFDDPYSSSTNYNYSDSDVAKGAVELFVTADDGGCSSFTDTTRVVFTSCNNISQSQTVITASPNPAQNYLVISYTDEKALGKAVVLDSYGNKVNVSWKNSTTLDISALPSGIYLVNVSSRTLGRSSIRFVKE